MTDNVISLGTGRPVAEEQKSLERAKEVHAKQLNEAAINHKATMLRNLDLIRQRIEKDEIDGLVIAGRNPDSGAFLSMAMLNTHVTGVGDYLAYHGILSTLQLDMTDMANAGPHMNPDGTFFALGTVQEIEDDGED